MQTRQVDGIKKQRFYSVCYLILDFRHGLLCGRMRGCSKRLLTSCCGGGQLLTPAAHCSVVRVELPPLAKRFIGFRPGGPASASQKRQSTRLTLHIFDTNVEKQLVHQRGKSAPGFLVCSTMAVDAMLLTVCPLVIPCLRLRTCATIWLHIGLTKT